MAFRFLDLPPELRIQIYHEIFDPEAFREDLGDGATSYKFDFSLFYVNKQVHQESRRVYLQNFTFVRVETPWGEASDHLRTEGRVPILVAGDDADTFQDFTLTISIEAPGIRRRHEDKKRMIFLADDLPTFCGMWFYSNVSYGGQLNREMSLTLKLEDNMAVGPGHAQPFLLQERLLIPFGAVKGLNSVVVKGMYSEEIAEAMKTEMKVPEDSPEKCLDDATKLELEGNKALKKGNPELGVELYLKSFKAMHIVCIGHYRGVWGESWFYKILRGGKYDGEDGNTVRLMLRVRLVGSMVQAYLNMGNWAEAHFWGSRTISIIDHPNQALHPINFPFAPDIVGQIYYRTGIACKLLGLQYEARSYLMTALKYLPQDDDLRRELASVTPLLIEG